MSIYIFVLISISTMVAPLMACRTVDSGRSSYNISISLIVFLFLFFFAALRTDVGFDFNNYKMIHTGVYETKVEPLYEFVQMLTRFFDDYVVHLLIVATISFGVKAFFFVKIIPSFSSALFLIYYSTSYLNLELGIIRQSLAVSCVLGMFYYYRKCNSKTFFLFLFACLFHYSAIIMYPIIYLSKVIKVNFLTLILMLLLSFTISYYIPFYREQIFTLLLVFGDKLSDYSEDITPIGITVGLVLKIMLSFTVYYVSVKTKINYEETKSLLFIYVSGLCVFIAFNSIPILAARMMPYFKIFECLLLVNFILCFKAGVSRFLVYLCVVFFISMQFYQFLNQDDTVKYYSNYQTVLSDLF
ncbi:EpsG family protein [Shewanella sp. SM20]|uniref:EpsG family protein n=1 Tax=Shewanella sp. SM20 TaxID=2912792 RepID=UPI0021DB788B|nr:EpsG family protein [Shewanella sp. SM20]MCU8093300.1 EpsG family protein [Shewanella sp. SM20]